MTARKEIFENLQIRFPDAKIGVRRATEKVGGGVAFIATVKNAKSAGKDLPKIMILSFDSSGREIQNADV